MKCWRHVKADAALRDVPIIMISALDEIDSVIRCIELGAEDYLNKPFNPTLLRARVGALLEKKRLRDEVRENLARLEEEMDAARAAATRHAAPRFPGLLLGAAGGGARRHAARARSRRRSLRLFLCRRHTFCFLVGDVSGKGASAAMFMARTRSLVRMTVELWRKWRTEEITRAHCWRPSIASFAKTTTSGCSSLCSSACWTPKPACSPTSMRVICCPCVLHASGDIEPQRQTGNAARRSRRYRVPGADRDLLPDDTVFVFSDGVTEAMNAADEFYGNERLQADLRAASAQRPEEMVGAIKAKVDLFTGEAPKSDDVTMLALRWQPAGARLQTSAAQLGSDTSLAKQPMPLPDTTYIVIRNTVADLAALTTAIERVGAEHGMQERECRRGMLPE